MRCKQASEVASHYVDGHLAPHVCREYEAHLDECPDCATALKETRELLASLRGLCERSPIDCWPALRDRLSCCAPPRRAWARVLLRPVVAAPVFAAAVLMAVLLMFPGQMGGGPGLSPASVPEYGRYVTAHAGLQQRQAFADPDVTFVAAELEKASAASDLNRP